MFLVQVFEKKEDEWVTFYFLSENGSKYPYLTLHLAFYAWRGITEKEEEVFFYFIVISGRPL